MSNATTRVLTADMILENITKGALRFSECTADGRILAPMESRIRLDDVGALIGALYLRKARLGGAEPKRIRVTVEVLP